MSAPLIDLLHELLEAGWLPPDLAKGRGSGRSAMQEAARRLDVQPQSLYSTLRKIKRDTGQEPDWTRYRKPPDQYTAYEDIHAPAPAEKPRVRVKAYTPDMPPDGPVHRVVVIGDLHDRPGRTKEHALHIGRHITAVRPDHVVCIGDFAIPRSTATSRYGCRNVTRDTAGASSITAVIFTSAASGSPTYLTIPPGKNFVASTSNVSLDHELLSRLFLVTPTSDATSSSPR
jgi:hypothetical protein